MKSDFEVMQIMCDRNLDIRAAIEVAGVKVKKNRAEVTIAMDVATGQQLANGLLRRDDENIVVMYIIDRKQFDEIKNEVDE